jgi:hypothetical protein
MAGLTANASQSSATELSCNDIAPQVVTSSAEKISTDSSSDETIKATFIEMSEMSPVQIHQPYMGEDYYSDPTPPPTKQHPIHVDQGKRITFSNERLSTRSSDSNLSGMRDDDNSMDTPDMGYATVSRKPCARKRRGVDSTNGNSENSSLESSQENGLNLQTDDKQSDSEIEEPRGEDYDGPSNEWNKPY